MALILVVDDSNTDGEIFRDFLESHAYQYQFAASGEEALGLIETKKFDLIISDFHMSPGDGIWLLQELKKRGGVPRCIIVTGDFMYDPKFFIEEGAAGFCFKPIIWSQLKLQMDKALSV